MKVFAIYVLAIFLAPTIGAQSMHRMTPGDMEGPFYPVERQSDEDNDLTAVKGKSGSAKGEVLYLKGVVSNKDGTPQRDVIVEIWQTDAKGLYRHPKDSSSGARDPHFQYWGKAKTDNEGKYSFRTIIPGEYEPRPPHIHFKLWIDGKVILTSQMYIVKDEDNSPNINELLQLNVTKNNGGEYSGFFRIVF